MPVAEERLCVSGLYKVFGEEPELGLKLHQQGLGKDEVFERSGQTVAVCDATFSVREGEIFVIMGLSGSGKSTLIRLLNRLIDPTAGSITFEGKEIATMTPAEVRAFRREHVSMVFQSFALMPHLTVIENVAFGLEMSGVSKGQRRIQALEALEQVGLSAWAESYPAELSGGMQQRVGLARALANEPTVMLMDEAFSALDPLIRSEMQDELLRLQDEHQRTILFVSHDLDEAMRLGDRIGVMEGGRLVQIGTPDEILNQPADEYVESFFRGVDISLVLTAGAVARTEQVTVIYREEGGVRAARERLANFDRTYGYVVDRSKRFLGVVSIDSLDRTLQTDHPNLTDAILNDVEAVSEETLLSDLMTRVAQGPCAVPVVDNQRHYMGAISRSSLLKRLSKESR